MTDSTDIKHPVRQVGGLFRHLAERRGALGLSIEETGERAGIDPTYLCFVEEHPDAHLSVGALLRLASVLETTPENLLGGPSPQRRGRRAGRHPNLQSLTRRECELRLAEGGIGRVVMSSERGPVALLVNYEYTDGRVVFSTDPVKAARVEAQETVGFEVDRIDDFLSDGWCVLVTGRARRVEKNEWPALASFDLETWNDGRDHTLMAITPDEITGRIIVSAFTPFP
jgi:transcriptional regulator with XRE-family HTH domain